MATKLKPHPLIKKLHTDLDSPPDFVELIGFLGPDRREGYYRVYPSLDLNTWTEIPEEAIARTEPLNPDNENSPTRIFVKRETQVRTVKSTTHDVADYLGGNIANSHLAESTNARPSNAFLTDTIDLSNPLCCCRFMTITGP